MTGHFYNFFIFLYWFCIHLAYPFSHKARQWVKGRRKWKQKLLEITNSKEKRIWFHCSSLGEFEDGRTVIESCKRKYPSIKIILTFSSPSGYENLKDYVFADHKMYMPYDFKRNVKAFIAILDPCAVFFIRSEIWINYIREIQSKKIPFYLISLNLDLNSRFITWPFKTMATKAFKAFDLIFCQNERTVSLLSKLIGHQNLKLSGNTRIDRILEVSGQQYVNKRISDFIEHSFCQFSFDLQVIAAACCQYTA